MIRSFGLVPVLWAVAASIGFPSSLLFAQSRTPPCTQTGPVVPGDEGRLNFQIDEMLEPLVATLLTKSPTFRRQWDTINASRLVRVSVRSRIGMQDETSARARAEVSRYAYGSLRVTIEIRSGIDITELLAHELEHVIEQLEGIDLPGLARRREQGVVEVRRGVYESARAKAAGLQVVNEVYGQTDPALDAAFTGMKRFWRALGGQSGPAGGSSSEEVPARPRTAAPGVPGPHLHKRR